MLEQLAHDSTGWPAHAVEFFELLGTTQNYNHLRLHNIITPDLRRTDVLELLDTPFDRIAHTVDMRHIASRRGKHNIPNIGLFLWRLQSYPLRSEACLAVSARALANLPDGRFISVRWAWTRRFSTFLNPKRRSPTSLKRLTCPGRCGRRPLYDELDARRQALAEGRAAGDLWFFSPFRRARGFH